MTRSIWIVGVFGFVLTLAAAWTGYLVDGGDGYPLHMGLSLAAGLALFLSQVWFVLYLLLTHRLLVRTGRETGWPELEERSRRFVLSILPFAVVTLAGVVVLSMLGGKILAGDHPVGVHRLVAWITLLAAALALLLEHGAARDHEALIREADARVSGGSTHDFVPEA
jgi:hypothetical protein